MSEKFKKLRRKNFNSYKIYDLVKDLQFLKNKFINHNFFKPRAF